jgi:hypothetical protein
MDTLGSHWRSPWTGKTEKPSIGNKRRELSTTNKLSVQNQK